ncbi:hypothetical protein [Cupriavidus taiwanensis]|uniref:hypothetical protein n=1 Tax=Cupriavidus taiwanensis TaxID=164546 RepID=UPI000E2E76DD|nr:hypothetical protein [Cupriavidus taiwanensis]
MKMRDQLATAHEMMTCLSDRFPVGSLEYRLSRFNAKERFALIQRVLGVAIAPHADFMTEVLAKCAITNRPENVFCAMDFHLDWLYAALMNESLVEDEPMPLVAGENDHFPVTGKQQDADFIMCFTENSGNGALPVTHLLLIEAKGVGSWDTLQIASKFNQYRAMRPAFARNPNVRTRLILMSQKDPEENRTRQNSEFLAELQGFRDFGVPVWVHLPMENTLSVVRCNADRTPNGKTPTHWKLESR